MGSLTLICPCLFIPEMFIRVFAANKLRIIWIETWPGLSHNELHDSCWIVNSVSIVKWCSFHGEFLWDVDLRWLNVRCLDYWRARDMRAITNLISAPYVNKPTPIVAAMMTPEVTINMASIALPVSKSFLIGCWADWCETCCQSALGTRVTCAWRHAADLYL